MKALLSTRPGDLGLSVELAMPRVGSDQVLIEVRACGVNYPDVLMVRDQYQFKPERPFAPGGEVAGEIVELGERVSGFRAGDRVIASVSINGMAEYVAADAVRCWPMPDTMPFDEGAAFFTTFGTAYHALRQRGGLQSGQTLLVLGAAGGVGLAAVQLGTTLGARVIAAVSSADKLALCEAQGAAGGVIYARGPLEDASKRELAARLKQACAPAGADLIYDAVGGDYSEPALRSIGWEGRFLIVGFTAGIPKIPLNLALLKGCQLTGVFYGSWINRNPEADRANRRELVELYMAGRIRPHISQRYSLEEGAKAIADLAERRARGKIVVIVE
jgi:NADPH:quinone reductase